MAIHINNEPTFSRPGRALPHLALLPISAAAALALACHLMVGTGLDGRASLGMWDGFARPWGLAWFRTWAVPIAVWVTTLCCVLVARWAWPGAGPHARKHRARMALFDAVIGLAAIIAALLINLFWTTCRDPLLAFGAVTVGLAFGKAALCLSLLRGRLAGEDGAPAPRPGIKAALFLIPFALLCALTPWIGQSLSTASDEVGYTLRAHSLLHHGTTEVEQAMTDREYKSFYWARWSERLAHQGRDIRATLYPYLLCPAYAFGGRAGILVLNAVIFGLVSLMMFMWLVEVGYSQRTALTATVVILSAAPILLMAQQAYPDVPGMLLFAIGLRLAWRAEQRPVLTLVGTLVIAALMFWLKTRLGIIGAGLVLAAFHKFLAARMGHGRAGLVSGGLAAAALAIYIFIIAPVFQVPWALARWWQPIWAFVSGLSLDQNFGALLAAPVLVVGLAALPAGLRAKPDAAFQALIPVGLFLAVLCYANWPAWHGGFASPARYLAVPLLTGGLFIAVALEALNRPWQRLIIWVPVGLGLSLSLLWMLVPHLRYGSPGGISRILEAAEGLLHMQLYHLVPSAFLNTHAMAWWFAALLVLSAWLARSIWRGRTGDAAHAASPWSKMEMTALIALVLAPAVLLVVAAKLYPPRILEAEVMASPVQRVWSPNNPLYLRGRVVLSGERIAGPLYFRGGPAGLRVVGLAGADGRLAVYVDRRQAAELTVKKNPGFVRKKMVGERTRGYFNQARDEVDLDLGDIPRGYHEVALTWRSCAGRDCWVLVDYLRLK